MDRRRFDSLARGIAAHGTRRGLLRGLAAAAGGASALGQGQPATLARALQGVDSDAQSVLLLEEMGRIAREHTGGCDVLGAALTQFIQDSEAIWAPIRTEQDAWTQEDRGRHADIYGARRLAAIAEVHSASAVRVRRFVGDP